MITRLYLAAWLESCSDLHPRTIDHYASLCRLYILPAIGDMEISLVRPEHVRAILHSILDAGHERTAEAVYVALKAATHGQDLHLMDGVRRPRHHQTSPEAWSDADMRKYALAIQGHKHEIALSLALYMGMRRGEICGLRWQDVDFSTGTVHICNQRQRLDSGQVVDCPPKSLSSDRVLPLPDRLLALMSAVQKPAGYLVNLLPSSLDHVHRQLVLSLGLPYIPLHGLRHSMATSCVRHGGDLPSLQRVLGHASFSVTVNRYTHPDRKMLESALVSAAFYC